MATAIITCVAPVRTCEDERCRVRRLRIREDALGVRGLVVEALRQAGPRVSARQAAGQLLASGGGSRGQSPFSRPPHALAACG